MLFNLDPLAPPDSPTPPPLLGCPRIVALPARLTYLGLAQCTAKISGQPHVA